MFFFVSMWYIYLSLCLSINISLYYAQIPALIYTGSRTSHLINHTIAFVESIHNFTLTKHEAHRFHRAKTVHKNTLAVIVIFCAICGFISLLLSDCHIEKPLLLPIRSSRVLIFALVVVVAAAVTCHLICIYNFCDVFVLLAYALFHSITWILSKYSYCYECD